MTTKKERDRADKEARARLRECFAKERTHIQAGDWRGPAIESIRLIGTIGQLHGTVCTCCPKRPDSPPDDTPKGASSC